MATCLKRSSKPHERLQQRGTSTRRRPAKSDEVPALRELICPVCRTILREPVTLPCAHNLCLGCLRGTVEHSSLSCPLCRQRVGSWLRHRTRTETSLVNTELWQIIRTRYPQELAAATGDNSGAGGSSTAVDDVVDLDPEYTAKKILSADGEIRREYEAQLQQEEEEMRRQREKERLASEALIKTIQEEEEQQKLMQLAQDQLLAKTLAKEEVTEKTNDKYVRSSKSSTIVNSNKTKADVNQSKSTINQKMSVKSKDATDTRKQKVALISKIRSERYSTTVKSNSANAQKESTETVSSQKSVPIHNAVARVVTHQNRLNQPNNATYPAALETVIGSTSKIYGLQSKEELHVPSDVLSNKKKKLGVEVCVTTVEGEDRTGSAESAGSHDSINQEIHHFKPIKALPRTPLRITIDGRQMDPKLIRVLPILKRVSNAVPKPPTPTHLKKMFGCSWSAFKRISRQQQVLQQDSPIDHQQQQETKKTDKKSEQSRTGKSSKTAQELEERNMEVAFDTNKNYTKNVNNKIVNGTKVSKKLNLDETQAGTTGKQGKRGRVKNGMILGKHKLQPSNEKTIEVVDLDEEDRELSSANEGMMSSTDPLAFTPKPRPPSPVMELAMENIAERIKRRKTTRTASNTENVQSAMNQVAPIERSSKTKTKKAGKRGRKPKVKTTSPVPVQPKVKTKKIVKVTTLTSQIKKLAARSSKRPRYTEDSESEEEFEEQRQLEANEEAELDRSNPEIIPSPIPSPEPTPEPPAKKSRKGAKSKTKSQKKQKASKKEKKETEDAPMESNSVSQESEGTEDDETVIQEQQRLERLAAQERKDRELALKLQAQFNAMERIAGRTRRGAARLPSPLPAKQESCRPQKRAALK